MYIMVCIPTEFGDHPKLRNPLTGKLRSVENRQGNSMEFGRIRADRGEVNAHTITMPAYNLETNIRACEANAKN